MFKKIKDIKIKTKIIIIIVLMITISSIFHTINTVYSAKQISEENIKTFKKETYLQKKEELLHYSQMANEVLKSYYERTTKEHIKNEVKYYIDEQSQYLFSILEGQYEKYKDTMSDDELKSLIKNSVASTRYGDSGYFWINDYEYKMIMHPIKKELTGQKFKDTPKVPFVELGVDRLKENQSDRGYIEYSFYSPSSKKYMHKASIVRVFEPYGWIIGTGAYIDDVSKHMKDKALEAIKHLRYGKNGYFWINDTHNKMLMHPIKPQYDGKTFVNTPKVPFVELGVDELKDKGTTTAFIEYEFYTPATKKYSHKLSVVSVFEPWGWVVGTGVYTDYVEEQIAQKRERTIKQIDSIIFKKIMLSMVTLTALILIIIVVTNILIVKPIKKFQYGLQSFFDYLEDPSKDVKVIDINSRDEFGQMSKSVNNSIKISIKTHSELASLLNTINKNVITSEIDSDGKIYYISDAFCKVSGYTSLELIGKRFDCLSCDDSLETYDEMWSSVNSDKAWTGEVKNLKKDGKYYWLNMIVNPKCIKDATSCSFTAISYDITNKKEVEYLSANLEQKVEARTADLEVAKKEIESVHNHTRDSIEYAALIQGALIPEDKLLCNYFKDSFVHWVPKDTVGGDIWLFNELRHGDECLLFFIDCTGHGVPGAFVTMIVKAIEREIAGKILKDDSIDVSTAWIMAYFNKTMKVLLKQIDKDAKSNAGWDGGIIYYNRRTQILKFSGAETPLFYTDVDGEFKSIKGSRYSVGYKKCTMDYEYKESIIEVEEGMKFYCTTDGYLDQNGGKKEFPFGKKRFTNIVKENHTKTMQEQKQIFVDEMTEYESMVENNDRNDDITVIAFEIDKKVEFIEALEIVKYEGVMTQNVIAVAMDNIKLKIRNINTTSILSVVVVELCQNMMNYAKNEESGSRQIVPAGSVEVQYYENKHTVICKNIVSLDDKIKIDARLKEICAMDKDSIKTRYRELRKSSENSSTKRVEIGFHEIVKLVDKMEYSFEAINEDKYYFEQNLVVFDTTESKKKV